MYLMVNLFNDFLLKVEIKFVPSKSIQSSGNNFDDCNCVRFLMNNHFGKYYVTRMKW